MTAFVADDLIAAEARPAAAPTGFGRHERDNGAKATLVLVNLAMLLVLAGFIWGPAVIFYAALILTPVTLGAIVGITRGWWL